MAFASNKSNVVSGNTINAADILDIYEALDGTSPYLTTIGIKDTSFTIGNASDTTKRAQFLTSGVTAGATRIITVPDSNTTLPIASQILTFAGPTAARTITFPDAAITVARTDAGQTFTGVQTFSSTITGSISGNAATATAVAVGGITGLGTGVATALAVNVGSAGAFITFNGDAGTPSALVGTNISGTAASLTAGTATLANTVASANEATDTTCFPLFITASGTQSLATKNNAGFTYNSNTNALTATTFIGALTGTASGNLVSGGALGTPSSGTGTNITGIPAGNILAGTLVAGTYLLAENASIGLDPAGSADGKYTGITVTGIGGATIAFGDLVTLDKDNSRWKLVDISAAVAADGDARGIIGIAVTSSSDGGALTILLHGIIRADANFPALTIGAAVFASTTGDIVVTQPVTVDHVIRVVGYALTADEIYFNPENDWITHT